MTILPPFETGTQGLWPRDPRALQSQDLNLGSQSPDNFADSLGKKSNFRNVFDGPETYVSSTRYTPDDVQVSGPDLGPPGPFNLRVSIWGPQGPWSPLILGPGPVSRFQEKQMSRNQDANRKGVPIFDYYTVRWALGMLHYSRWT